MAKFPLYQWKKATGTGDTTGLAKLNANNTFTGKNTFESTANVVSIKSTDDQSFGIEFENNTGQRVGYIGTSPDDGTTKTTVWGINGLILKTSNNSIKLSPGRGHVISTSTINWNNYLDNEVVRAQDLKWTRFFEYTTGVSQPSTNWNTTTWTWTVNNLTSQNGFYQFMIIVSIGNVAYSLNGTVVWKNGLTESKSQFITISDGSNTYDFQLVIKQNNNFRIYHKKSGGSNNIDWVRGWILRGNNYPWKANNLW